MCCSSYTATPPPAVAMNYWIFSPTHKMGQPTVRFTPIRSTSKTQTISVFLSISLVYSENEPIDDKYQNSCFDRRIKIVHLFIHLGPSFSDQSCPDGRTDGGRNHGERSIEMHCFCCCCFALWLLPRQSGLIEIFSSLLTGGICQLINNKLVSLAALIMISCRAKLSLRRGGGCVVAGTRSALN